MTPGVKVAKFIAARLSKSPEKGTPCIEVALRVRENDKEETVYWRGWLSPAASARTHETMIEVLGFNGDDQLDARQMFKNTSFARAGEDCEVTIEEEVYDGKTRLSVRWLNRPGGGMKFKELTPDESRQVLATTNFKGEHLAALARLRGGISAPSAPKPVSAPIPSEEIPF